MKHAANPVSVRPLESPDADVLARWAEDPGFCAEAGWSADLTYAEQQRFHRELIWSPPAELIRLGAIHEGVLVGYVDLHGDEPHRRELGFVIGERARWGQGLGHLAAAAGLDHGFGQLRLRTIWAEAPEANQRSVRILQRLGLVETGRGADDEFLGRPTYYRQFAMASPDWRIGRG